jgi:hypothetical protein
MDLIGEPSFLRLRSSGHSDAPSGAWLDFAQGLAAAEAYQASGVRQVTCPLTLFSRPAVCDTCSPGLSRRNP